MLYFYNIFSPSRILPPSIYHILLYSLFEAHRILLVSSVPSSPRLSLSHRACCILTLLHKEVPCFLHPFALLSPIHFFNPSVHSALCCGFVYCHFWISLVVCYFHWSFFRLYVTDLSSPFFVFFPFSFNFFGRLRP